MAALTASASSSMGPKTSYEAYLEDHLHRMHHEIEVTTRKLELEKRRLNKLEEDANRARSEYDEKVMPKKHKREKDEKAERYKAAMEDKGGGGSKGQDQQSLMLSMKKQENRLAKVIAKLNSLNHDNTELREKIDQIRRERLQFNQVFKRLHEDIKDNARHITQIQVETDSARETSEEARRRVSAMKKKLEVERREFKEGVERLQEDLKSVEKMKKELEVRLFKGDGSDTRKGFLVADEENAFSESGFMKRILKLAFLNTIQRRHIKQHQKNIEVFEQAFATIKSTTGISDIEEIVKIFVKLEERNFSLLTYVNQLNREIESLEKRNKELGEQIQSQRRLEADGELRRRSVLQDLKTQIQNTKAAIDENTRSYDSQTEIIEKCRPIVTSVSRVVEKENRAFVGGPPTSELNYDNLLEWLAFIERTLTQWRDFIPETKDTRQFKPFPYTVGSSVKALPPKRPQAMWAPPPLIRAADLPSAVLTQDQTAAAPRVNISKDDGSESDEEDYGDHPWTRAELKDKTLASLTKRRKMRKAQGEAPDASTAGRMEEKTAVGDMGGERDGKELNYNDMVEKKGGGDGGSDDDEESDGDLEGPSDEEINEIFLRRYKMTKEELQAMADKMGIALNNLCYLKQEFDTYDEDRSGYIDVKELKELLEKLGEELTEEELEQAFKELDTDNSGEIEFFEFVEWFTCDD